ncbi:MAG TPA: sugar ABC transporter ATP-binding protein [Phycisphaerae bacterium]|nr:sugar ABC transporter ATP-binding protein [Phycisphaerae bacterium]
MNPSRLEIDGLRKVYPGTVALDGISVTFEGGKVTALIGKNGAGKSTLVKILAGAMRPTSGDSRLNGRLLDLRSPADAIANGIATVHQELSLVPGLTVGENILLGRLPKRRGTMGLVIDWERTVCVADSLLRELGISLDVKARVSQLRIAQQQVVEIAKTMAPRIHADAKAVGPPRRILDMAPSVPTVLMLDEPTSALARTEVERLFELIRSLAKRGVIVIYVSHRLHELPQIADRVVALRDGKLAGSSAMQDASPKTIVQMMFGDALTESASPTQFAAGKVALEVRGLRMTPMLHDVSFSLHSSEILGIAGMLGSGRTELLMAIFGAMRVDGGQIFVAGRCVQRPTPARMKRLGIALAPENRKTQGIVPLMSIRDNACLAGLARIAKHCVIWKARQRPVVQANVRDLQIRAPGIERPITALSGGNQQKVVIGNWLNTRPRVMLFDEPTRGIDVQAKAQIFDIIRGLARDGIACIFVSSELEELPEVCHRILVLRRGRIAADMPVTGLNLETLFEACMEP